jgi:hypothetical protein
VFLGGVCGESAPHNRNSMFWVHPSLLWNTVAICGVILAFGYTFYKVKSFAHIDEKRYEKAHAQ